MKCFKKVRGLSLLSGGQGPNRVVERVGKVNYAVHMHDQEIT